MALVVALFGVAASHADTITVDEPWSVAPEVEAATPVEATFGDDANVSLAQSFSVGSAFSAEAIYLVYENDANAYTNWNMTVTIFEVADVQAANLVPGTTVYTGTLTFPAPVGFAGSDTIARIDLTTPLALNASVGTEGYALQITESSGGGFNPGFEWLRTGSSAGNVYAGGSAYEDGVTKGLDADGRDFSLAISSIPEPAAISLFAALGGGILFIRRRFMQ